MVSSLSGLYTFKSVNRDFGLSMKKLKHERKKERKKETMLTMLSV